MCSMPFTRSTELAATEMVFKCLAEVPNSFVANNRARNG